MLKIISVAMTSACVATLAMVPGQAIAGVRPDICEQVGTYYVSSISTGDQICLDADTGDFVTLLLNRQGRAEATIGMAAMAEGVLISVRDPVSGRMDGAMLYYSGGWKKISGDGLLIDAYELEVSEMLDTVAKIHAAYMATQRRGE